MSDQKKALKDYCSYLDKLDKKHLALIHKYYAKDVRFHDPIHDFQGLDKLKLVYTAIFDTCEKVRFKVVSAQYDKEQSMGLLRWDCLQKTDKSSYVISAMSELTFDKESKIVSQIDFWDSAPMLESRYAFIGSLVKEKKKRLRIVS